VRDALEASQELSPVYRRLLTMALEEWQLLDRQILRLDQEVAELLRPVSWSNTPSVRRLLVLRRTDEERERDLRWRLGRLRS
jgi:hypothetical protein